MDVTSEYPWVNKTEMYPLYHPIIEICPQNQDLDSYYGLLKVDVLPPAGLFHPVLPNRYKMKSGANKLTFPLCAACVAEETQKTIHERTHVCGHSDKERTLRGTWCTPQLKKAVEMGYRVIKIHEAWHFEHQERGLCTVCQYLA